MNARGVQFTAAEVRELIDELTRRVSEQGVVGTIRVVGGAAMALNFPDDAAVRVTRDIDAVYMPAPEVDAVIRQMTLERRLEPGWINSAEAPWLRVAAPSPNPSSFVAIVATPKELVAMKLAAGREWDLVDLQVIARHLEIRDAETLVDMAYDVFGKDAVELPDGRDSYLLLARAALPPVE